MARQINPQSWSDTDIAPALVETSDLVEAIRQFNDCADMKRKHDLATAKYGPDHFLARMAGQVLVDDFARMVRLRSSVLN